MIDPSTENQTRKKRLLGALGLTSVFLVVEALGGLMSGSVALLARRRPYVDRCRRPRPQLCGPRRLSSAPRRRNTASAFSARRSWQRSSTPRYFSWREASSSTKPNGRWSDPPEVATGLMLGVAVAGLLANIVSMRLLHGGRLESLNVKAAYLEIFTDMLGSIGVIGAAFVMARHRLVLGRPAHLRRHRPLRRTAHGVAPSRIHPHLARRNADRDRSSAPAKRDAVAARRGTGSRPARVDAHLRSSFRHGAHSGSHGQPARRRPPRRTATAPRSGRHGARDHPS